MAIGGVAADTAPKPAGREGPIMKQSDVIIRCFIVFLVAAFCRVCFAAEPESFRTQVSAAGRVALVIGNATYPDDDRPLAHPIKDARAIADELRRADFEVISGEDVTKQKLRALLDSFKAEIKPGSTVLVFFSGYGIQSGKQSYIIPVDAQIRTEGDVKREAISIEAILADINAAGPMVKLVIIDGARRNPFERRFRGLSTGLAPLTAPAGTLAIYSAAPDREVNDFEGANSVFVTELLKKMRPPGLIWRSHTSATPNGYWVFWASGLRGMGSHFIPTIRTSSIFASSEQVALIRKRMGPRSPFLAFATYEAIFNSTQQSVSRASKGEQVPWVSSSPVDDFFFGKGTTVAAPPPPPSSKAASAAPPPSPSTVASQAPRPSPPPPAAATNSPPAPSPATAATNSPPASSPPAPPAAAAPAQPSSQVASRPMPGPPPDAQHDQALSELNDAIGRNPRDPDLYYRRGQVFAKKQKFAPAMEDFGRAIDLNPNHTEALNNRCFARAVLGELDAALTDCTAALKLRPKYTDALDSRGLTHLKLNQFDRAIADFDDALRLSPRFASALYGRGKAKLKKGDRAGGNADIQAAKAINSGIDREFESYGVE
jgi:regulator of sirC expression with transglutaminase-like and TPR domain